MSDESSRLLRRGSIQSWHVSMTSLLEHYVCYIFGFSLRCWYIDTLTATLTPALAKLTFASAKWTPAKHPSILQLYQRFQPTHTLIKISKISPFNKQHMRSLYIQEFCKSDHYRTCFQQLKLRHFWRSRFWCSGPLFADWSDPGTSKFSILRNASISTDDSTWDIHLIYKILEVVSNSYTTH